MVNTAKPELIAARLDGQTAAAVDEYRETLAERYAPAVVTKSDAVRALIELGLRLEERD